MTRFAPIAAACVAACTAVPAMAATQFLQFSVTATGTRFDYVPCVIAGADSSCEQRSPFSQQFSYAQNFEFINGVASYDVGDLRSVGEVSFTIRDLGDNLFEVDSFSYGRTALAQGPYGFLPGSYYISASAAPFVISSVPEPGTWAMLMLGFGALGYAMRRPAVALARVRFA